eukprot:COSAG01_NODE_28619_length_656_cov_12.008977_2_plen_33_part_01
MGGGSITGIIACFGGEHNGGSIIAQLRGGGQYF